MQRVSDWYDSVKGAYVVQCERDRSVSFFTSSDALRKMLEDMEKELPIEFIEADQFDSIYAIPAFACLADICGIDPSKQERLLEFISHNLGPEDCHYVFIGKIEAEIPENLLSCVEALKTVQDLSSEFFTRLILDKRPRPRLMPQEESNGTNKS